MEPVEQIICIKDVVMDKDHRIEFTKGQVYKKRHNSALFNNSGEPGHIIMPQTDPKFFEEHFSYDLNYFKPPKRKVEVKINVFVNNNETPPYNIKKEYSLSKQGEFQTPAKLIYEIEE